jgi:DNA-binding transcriptional LysR family regulator
LPVELRHLRFIVAAADHRSFRQAAETLGVRQSTLSRSIRMVEVRLGLQLFERTNAGTRTTHAGTSFVEGARLIVETTAGIVESARAAGRGDGGQLSIGAHSSLSAGHLRSTLAAFREQAADVDIYISEGSRDRLLFQLRAGLMDIAIVTGEKAGASLLSVPVWSDKIVVAIPPNHLLTARETLYWTDLAGQTLLISSRDPGPHLEAHLFSKLASPDAMPHIQRQNVTHATLVQLAGAGLGLALLCETSVELGSHIQVREVRDGVGPSGLPHTAHFRRDHRNPALVRFLEFLRERYPSR